MSRFSLLAIILLIPTLEGCATIIKPIFRPKNTITTIPKGAEVIIDKQVKCTTPCVLELDSSRKEYNMTLSHPDFEPAEIYLKRGVFWPFIVNAAFLIYSPIFFGIDWATGAMWRIKPRKVFHDFTKFSEKRSETSKTPKKEDAEEDTDDEEAPPEPTAPQTIILKDDHSAKTEKDEKKKPVAKDDDDKENDISPTIQREVIEAYSEQDLSEQIAQRYGNLPEKEMQKAIRRVRRILAEQAKNQEPLDLDTAIMVDYARSQK